MKKKILFTHKLREADIKLFLEKLGDIYELVIPRNYTEYEIEEYISEIDICIGVTLNDKLLRKANKLEVFQSLGTGVERLNLKLFLEKNVKVCNTHAHAKYVAEFSVSLLFSLIKKIHIHHELVSKGNWWRPANQKNDIYYQSGTIFDKKVGFIGFGEIGQKIGVFLKPYNVEVIAYDLNKEIKYKELEGTSFDNLNNLIEKSDIIFITLPLTSKTRDLISANELSLAKSNSLWVHISRGPVVNEKDLYDSLSNNEIGGIAIDNWFDPPKKDKYGKTFPSTNFPFHELRNVLVSPYRAMYVDGITPHINEIIDNLVYYQETGILKNIVDLNKEF